MDYPSVAPSSRQYTPGDWPVKAYSAMDGYEVRILFGDRRTGMKLRLDYKAIPDATAESFLQHYESVRGTFQAFRFPNNAIEAGWSGTRAEVESGYNDWRYEGPPQLEQLRPGVSSVTVNLVAVLN